MPPNKAAMPRAVAFGHKMPPRRPNEPPNSGKRPLKPPCQVHFGAFGGAIGPRQELLGHAGGSRGLSVGLGGEIGPRQELLGHVATENPQMQSPWAMPARYWRLDGQAVPVGGCDAATAVAAEEVFLLVDPQPGHVVSARSAAVFRCLRTRQRLHKRQQAVREFLRLPSATNARVRASRQRRRCAATCFCCWRTILRRFAPWCIRPARPPAQETPLAEPVGALRRVFRLGFTASRARAVPVRL